MKATSSFKTRVDDNKEKVEVGRETASTSAGDIGKFAQKKRGSQSKDAADSVENKRAEPENSYPKEKKRTETVTHHRRIYFLSSIPSTFDD